MLAANAVLVGHFAICNITQAAIRTTAILAPDDTANRHLVATSLAVLPGRQCRRRHPRLSFGWCAMP